VSQPRGLKATFKVLDPHRGPLQMEAIVGTDDVRFLTRFRTSAETGDVNTSVYGFRCTLDEARRLVNFIDFAQQKIAARAERARRRQEREVE
jgi:hypothetical protein